MIVAAIVLGVLILLYLILIFPSLNKKDRLFDRCRTFAHRGLFGGDIPENSRAAYKKAVEAGYGIEFDVHVTTDNVAVVSHDDKMTRMFSSDQWIEKCTYDEIKEAKLPNGETLPLLEEVLEIVHGKVPLMVELKCTKTDKRVADITAEIMKKYDGEYCVESFNPIVVGEYRKKDPKVLCGQLAGFEPTKGMKFSDKLTRFLAGNLLLNRFSNPDFISYQYEHRNNLSMNICKFFGSYVSMWTINTKEKHEECRKRKVVSIFQDFLA